MTSVLDRHPVTTLPASRPADIRVRPMLREDAAALDEIFDGLSEHSRYLRYHAGTPALTARMRRTLLDVDGRRHLARVAETVANGRRRAIGVARALDLGGGCAELAVEVVDDWHRRGVGTLLLRAVRDEAFRVGYVELHAHVLPANRAMLRLLSQLSDDVMVDRVDGTLRVRVGAGPTTY